MVDDSGEVTTQEVKAVETDDGMKVVVPTDDGGYVPVVVPDIPDDIQQEIVEEVPEAQLSGSNFMTKDEFRQWIAQRYEDTLTELKKEEQRLEDEEAKKAGCVSQLEDCIEQAANKFGYYGVYEQPPHYQNAVDWVENDCLAGKWQPERRMLRR
ncbi:putative storage protein LPV [Phytophthora cinnamomi]|uniref:putative storage protein LPV n=1 Tax=Phytophthora cinnamomi TaxID=4785 RepID=UPI003559BF68|nr:putative storage protein LPV [Phytophthora cinnamomi]